MNRNRVKFLFFLFVLALSQNVFSAVQLKPVSPEKLSYTPVFFSQTHQQVSLELTGLKKCTKITATLWQMTSRLGAVLAEQTLIDCAISQFDFTQPVVKLTLDFKTPRVKQETLFKWEFTRCDDMKPCESIGRFSFSVVAEDLLKPIRNWAKVHQLYVFDKSYHLQSFFDKNSIEYIGSKRLLIKNEPLIYLVVVSKQGVDIDALLPEANKQALMVFYQNSREWPVIVDKTHGNRPLIEVYVPLVEMLDHDAAAQKLLLKLFYSLPFSKE